MREVALKEAWRRWQSTFAIGGAAQELVGTDFCASCHAFLAWDEIEEDTSTKLDETVGSGEPASLSEQDVEAGVAPKSGFPLGPPLRRPMIGPPCRTMGQPTALKPCSGSSLNRARSPCRRQGARRPGGAGHEHLVDCRRLCRGGPERTGLVGAGVGSSSPAARYRGGCSGQGAGRFGNVGDGSTAQVGTSYSINKPGPRSAMCLSW